jgi:AcrR family transcriptional regulator
LFAANGYAKVTVRDICTAAGANVAAINYHFGGKTGLYEQVLRRAITVMQATTHEAIKAGADRHPREQLKAYLSIFMRRVFAGRDSWIHQMMMRELADPTPALDLVVEEVMKPRMQYLARVVGALLDAPPTDARVRLCAVSVQAQCLAVLRSGFSDRLDMVRVDERSIDDVAEHIARFLVGRHPGRRWFVTTSRDTKALRATRRARRRSLVELLTASRLREVHTQRPSLER